MNIYPNSANLYSSLNLIDIELCRICGTSSNDLNSMFDDDGSAYDFSSKINEYLPITVRKSDYLPQKICSMCATTLLSFHQLYIVCQSTNARFLQSLEGDAYDHHVGKNPVAVDTSEFLELQSSFSREIENEILHMNESKEINEAESEIAANAAVTELERIGSAENISFVEEVAMDPVLDIEGLQAINNTKPSEVNENADAKIVEKTPPVQTKSPRKSQVKNSVAKKAETKKESTKKQQKNEETKHKTNGKDKGKVTKSPRNGLSNNQKAEILKHSGVQQKPTGKVNGSKIKSESLDTAAEKIESGNKPSKLKCDYCTSEFDTKSVLIEHIKDLHNDLIFHCEMCDDYVARIDLISHMLNHALNANNVAVTTNGDADQKILVELPPQENNNAEEVTKETKNAQSKENKQPATVASATPAAKGRTQYFCEDCKRFFADSGGYKYHINHFHKKIKQYQCDICGNHFSCKRVITNHIRGVHLKERIFECDQCAKKFSTDSALYMHKKIHENIFNCVCQVCDRKFRSMSKLKIHMTMHTKEKNYFCEICQRGFAVRNNLTKHLMTHSKAFDFKCDKCSYKSNQKRYLAEHVKRAHKTSK